MKHYTEDEPVPLSVVDFLEVIEAPLKEAHLPQERGRYIYTSMLGTARELSAAENVRVAVFLERENLRHAQQLGFRGVFTTNANRLTQEISASKSSIRRFVITEKAPTRAFSWLKAATTAFTLKTLLTQC